MDINRRDLIKLAGMTALGVAVGNLDKNFAEAGAVVESAAGKSLRIFWRKNFRGGRLRRGKSRGDLG